MSDTAVGAVLHELLDGGELTAGDPKPLYSLLVQADTGPVGDPVHQLFRGTCPVVRTTDPARAVGALLTHIDAHRRPLATGSVRTPMLCVVRNGTDEAALLQSRAGRRPIPERQLARAGWRYLDTPFTDILLDSGSTEAPALAGSVEGFARSLQLSGRADPPVPSRSLRVAAIVSGDPDPGSLALRLQALQPSLGDPARTTLRAGEGGWLRAVRWLTVAYSDPDALRQLFAEEINTSRAEQAGETRTGHEA